MTAENILRVFDVPPDKQEKWICCENEMPTSIDCSDYTDNERVIEPLKINLEWLDNAYWLFPDGRRIYSFNEDYIKPLLDEPDYLTYHKRETVGGGFVLACKVGLEIKAIIFPAVLHKDEHFTAELERIANAYAVMDQEQTVNAADEIYGAPNSPPPPERGIGRANGIRSGNTITKEIATMKTISVINLKGGVAKTISAANIAHILAVLHSKRVLLVDNDKQGNISKMFRLHGYDNPSITDLLTQREANIYEVITPTQYKTLDIITANMTLLRANMEVLLDSTRPQQTRLRTAFRGIADDYDYCVIDCAPDLNISTINALVASDDVLIPIKIDKFAFDGLAELKEQLDNTREDLNPGLTLRGCFVTSYQNNEVNRQGEAWLREQAEYPLFNTHIRRTEKVDESTFANTPIIEYSRRCGAARDYIALVAEYLETVSDSDAMGGN